MNTIKSGLIVFLYLFSNVCAAAEAGQAMESKPCVLPVADGSDITPTEENLRGIIVKARSSYIQLKTDDSDNIVNVKLNSKTGYFTIFGGDFVASDLQKGQEAWVWYRDCRKENKNLPAAVVQVYSLDPDDINPERSGLEK